MSTINVIQTTATPSPPIQKRIRYIIAVVFASIAALIIAYFAAFIRAPQQEIGSTVNYTSVNIDHALARGTSLRTILDHPGSYTDKTFGNMTVTINAGSCGIVATNAYTVHATDTHGNYATFTTKGNKLLIGSTSAKNNVDTQLCK